MYDKNFEGETFAVREENGYHILLGNSHSYYKFQMEILVATNHYCYIEIAYKI